MWRGGGEEEEEEEEEEKNLKTLQTSKKHHIIFKLKTSDGSFSAKNANWAFIFGGMTHLPEFHN